MKNKVIDLIKTDYLSYDTFIDTEDNTSKTTYGLSMPGCDIKKYRDALIKIRDYQSESMSAADLQIIAEKALEDD